MVKVSITQVHFSAKWQAITASFDIYVDGRRVAQSVGAEGADGMAFLADMAGTADFISSRVELHQIVR